MNRNGNGNGRVGNRGRATKRDEEVPKGPVTFEDFAKPLNRRMELRNVPFLTIDALKMLRQAAPRQMIATFALQVLAASMAAIQLLTVRYVLSGFVTVAQGGSVARLIPAVVALVATSTVVGVTSQLTEQQQHLLTELVGRHTFNRIIDVSTAVDLEAFDTSHFYDQLDRARTSAMVHAIQTVGAVSSLVTGVLMTIGIGAALVVFQPLLLPFVFLAGLPVMAATVHNSRAAYTFEWGLTPANRERMYLMELLTDRPSAKEVRAFGSIPFLRRRYDYLTEERIRQVRKFVRQRVRVALVGNLAGTLGMAVAVTSLVWLLAHHSMSVPTAITAALAMQQLSGRLNTVTTAVGSLIESGMFIGNYNRFIALAPDATPEASAPAPAAEPSARPRPRRQFEGLRLEDVSFTYPFTQSPVLHDVSLDIAPGEVVALVGENGSGKTTLVKLICQLYRPTAGRILWNGHDVRSLPLDEIRDEMTVIFQDYVQYHLSATDNISLGRVEREPTLEAIVGAAEHAGAHGFLSSLPEGYRTQLGRQFYGGQELSVGQWQRLALARAFFRDGSFLVLDEPTASLDPRAEHDLFTRMRTLASGRSVLLVSHRFSSVRSADRIYVLDQGRIAEHGSHEELMAAGGRYAELFELQATAYLRRDRVSA